MTSEPQTVDRSFTRLLWFLPFALLSGGCPFGDCWGKTTHTIQIANGVPVPDSGEVVWAAWNKIDQDDVTGTTAQGVPLGSGKPIKRRAALHGETRTANATDDLASPYPTWFVAYIDLNKNDELDPGEFFGTDPKNPIDPGCGSYSGTIVIDRKLP